jgi:hypothetical protein
MTSSVTKVLAAGALFFAGLQAGVTLNRALVELPAWRRVGVLAWAGFTRAENVGVGAAFYPVLGLVAIVATVATAVAYRFDKDQRLTRSIPVYTAAAITVFWAVITRVVLVPQLSSLKLDDSPSRLQQIFGTVLFGSAINDALHLAAFALSLWALIELCSDESKKRHTLPT